MLANISFNVFHNDTFSVQLCNGKWAFETPEERYGYYNSVAIPQSLTGPRFLMLPVLNRQGKRQKKSFMLSLGTRAWTYGELVVRIRWTYQFHPYFRFTREWEGVRAYVVRNLRIRPAGWDCPHTILDMDADMIKTK